MYEEILKYISSGGFVMWPILFIGILSWIFLWLRLEVLNRGFKGSVQKRLDFLSHAHENSLKNIKHDGILERVLLEAKLLLKSNWSTQKKLNLLKLVNKKAEKELSKFRDIIRVLYSSAPLLGLLGTVTGMVETFSSLTVDLSVISDQSMAGGISKALISTQMGLFIAIPALIFAQILDRKEERLREEISRSKELFMAQKEKLWGL